MYSIMAARFKYFPEVKTKGMAAVPKLVLFTSEHVSWVHLLMDCGVFQGTLTFNVQLLFVAESLFHKESWGCPWLWNRQCDFDKVQ